METTSTARKNRKPVGRETQYATGATATNETAIVPVTRDNKRRLNQYERRSVMARWEMGHTVTRIARADRLRLSVVEAVIRAELTARSEYRRAS